MSRLIDWKTVCLVCLKKGENRSIFEQDTETNLIADKIMKCGDIFIEKDTDQPKSICLQCLDNLNVTYKFHRNYEQSDSVIKAVLSTNHKEFPIKDLWKTTPFRGAQQTESPQNEILHIEESANSDEINIKHEIIENYVVDDNRDKDTLPSIELGDNIDTEAKLVVKDSAEACLQGSAIEQNDVKANKRNKICGICNRAYKHLKIHMRRHKQKRPFSCDRCDKTFLTSWKLRRHMGVHTGEKSYECQYCDRRFTENKGRKIHERMHTGEKPYKCQYCDHRFAVTSSRKIHERTHTGEKPFVCPTCGKTFSHSGNLSQHLRSHTGVKKFMCEECGKRFCRREYLESHVRRHLSRDKLDKSSEHKQKKVLEKEIFQIVESAQSNEINIKHEIIEHDVVDDTHNNDTSSCIDLEDNIDAAAKLVLKEPAESCFQGSAIELNDLKANESNKIKQNANDEISGRESKPSIENSYDKPSRNTVGIKPFKICEICNRAFICQSLLDIHMRRHKNERPFSCDLCDKAYVSSQDLRRHMKVHTAEKPYECQYCNHRFSSKSQRKIHERIHTGERPFVCSTCGKSFAYSHVLSKHRRIHTDVKKFRCEKCGKGFTRREALESHVRRHVSRDKLDKSSDHKQMKVLEKEILQIEECDKSNENIEHDVVDDTHDNDNSPYIDLEDNIDTAAKLVLKDPAEACFQGSTIELNDVEANKSNNICEICNRAFTCLAKLNIHMRRHNNKRPFSCDLCDKAYVWSADLRRHMKVHMAEKPYKCLYCDHRFTGKSQRKIHERIHTGEKPFVCSTCGKSFAYSHALSDHRRIHNGVKKFMCEECGKGFNRRKSLESHVRLHQTRDKLNKSSEHKQKKVLEKEIPQIEECAKSNEINIKDEIIENDVVGDTHDNDTSPCIDLRDNINTKAKLILKALREACFQGSTIELNDLKANESNKIKQDANDEISGRESKPSIENAYDKPSRKTVGIKPFKICQSLLDIHMRHNNNERPFSCDLCDIAYDSSQDLRRHMKVHTAEKPYECQYCDHRFAKTSQRKTHERIHTGERPFVCTTCGKSFASSHALSNHRRIHVRRMRQRVQQKGISRRACTPPPKSR